MSLQHVCNAQLGPYEVPDHKLYACRARLINKIIADVALPGAERDRIHETRAFNEVRE